MSEHYEILYIIPIQYGPDNLQPIIDKVNKTISDIGGNITLHEDLGKKKLAYPIKQVYQGYYILNEFDLDKDKLNSLNSEFKLLTELLRFQIIKKRIQTKDEIKKQEKMQEKQEKLKEEKLKQELKQTEKQAQSTEEEKTKTHVSKKTSEKASIEQLDEKLQKILNDSDFI